MALKDQRKNQRFDLRLPFELVRNGARSVDISGETRNLSSSGVLFTANTDVQVGEPIEFLITLPTGATGQHVRLRCVGKVVRRDKVQAHDMAATVERFEFVRTNVS